MSAKPKSVQLPLPGFEAARSTWQADYTSHIGEDASLHNRSGIEIKPLYTPDDWPAEHWHAR